MTDSQSEAPRPSSTGICRGERQRLTRMRWHAPFGRFDNDNERSVRRQHRPRRQRFRTCNFRQARRPPSACSQLLDPSPIHYPVIGWRNKPAFLWCLHTSLGVEDVSPFRRFHSIAALCGNGLRPEPQALFDRLAVDPHSELFVRQDGMVQSGPDPISAQASFPNVTGESGTSHADSIPHLVPRQKCSR
jgi:hypothetical protein